jgi:hypothetical protein
MGGKNGNYGVMIQVRSISLDKLKRYNLGEGYIYTRIILKWILR